MNRFLWLLPVLTCTLHLHGQFTWTECQALAHDNYPLIKQYDLVEQSAHYTVANAAKAWLPQASLSAQASYQSDVAAFPEAMAALYQQIGIDMKGLHKDQYRTTLEINQTLWDGGRFKAQKALAKAESERSKQSLEVEMYAVRERVNNLYFGLLMLQAELSQNRLLQELLQRNLQTADSYLDQGVAMQGDLKVIQAELLTVAQQRIRIESLAKAYRDMLSVMIGKPVGETETFPKPPVQTASLLNHRLELNLFEAQSHQFEVQKQAIEASLMPRLGLFAQGFYGNPGLNLFKDMTEARWTWNYLAGIRFQWTFGTLYTRNGSLRKLEIAQKQTDNRRDVFLFNQNLQVIRQQEEITKMQRIIADDDKLISLRTFIRKASEAKLANGTITVSDLLRDITAESQAMQAKALHEIEWLKSMYDLACTMNE